MLGCFVQLCPQLSIFSQYCILDKEMCQPEVIEKNHFCIRSEFNDHCAELIITFGLIKQTKFHTDLFSSKVPRVRVDGEINPQIKYTVDEKIFCFFPNLFQTK